ncbi:hypothetical protein TSUD_212360 [Trifolium subterraneum]|uniref:non-specific serine/threonine protein kinase n=1 Tax=Trifolium subterraneum TaxID=3900 RepID=A0A2Z6NHG1_TRISU|nr:hypothetical protein TSUD_212360 [Trifolium subterraneum]
MKMRLLVVALCLLFLFLHLYSVSALNSDGLALLSFMSHWTFVPPRINSTWIPSHSTPCSWEGVQCDTATRRVVSLNLSYYHIPGQLRPEIANCTQLKDLDLSYNYFTGQIPHSFNNLHKLTLLDLSINLLTGSIPTSIGNMTQLRYLYLQNNTLSGTIPSTIGNCTQLQELFLNFNQFQGVIPHTLNTNLLRFDVAGNKLTGTIPFGSSSGCQNLLFLDISFNFFSGGIPSAIGNCTSLSQFAAVRCNLVGTIPSSIGLLTKLSILHLPENHLSGKIPPEIELQLGGNLFGGRIPRSVGALQNLIYGLNLSSNGLMGDIPVEIGKLKTLQMLDLSQNNLTGSIQVLDELPSLVQINISYNSFQVVRHPMVWFAPKAAAI